MTETTTTGTAQELYDAGQFTDALEAAITEGDPVLQAWCYYRLKNYDDARRCAEEAFQTDQGRALEVLAYLAAYVDKDDVSLLVHVDRLPGNVNATNALVIRARDSDSFTHEEVATKVAQCLSGTEVAVANLFHNASRFFLAKKRGWHDLITALGYIEIAITKYGADANWHHRAAANFWKSKMMEDLCGAAAAIPAQQESVRLWRVQAELDPTNEQFQKNLQGGVDRLNELTT